MGIFDGCILACDIDGTLMVNGYIHPRNIEKIEFFMSEGGFFSISTGRSVGAISSVTQQLKRISPSIVFNGCMIYDYQANRVLYEKCLPGSDKFIVKKILDSGYDFGIEIHSGHNVYTLKQTKETDDHQKYEDIETTLADYDTVKSYNWNKILFALEREEDYDVISDIVSHEKLSSKFVKTCATLYGRKRNYFEQVPLGVSKATAMDKLCEILNIKNNCIFAMGDYYNDLEMLKNADISAVPLGAPDDLKSIAGFVAGACEDGAVADFIDYLTAVYTNKKGKD